MFVPDGVFGRIPIVAALIWSAVWGTNPARSSAADHVRVGRVRVGIGGCVKVGRWASCHVEFNTKPPNAVFVEAADPLGDLVRYPMRRVTGAKTARFRGLFQVGRLDGVPHLLLRFADGRETRRRIAVGTEGEEMRPVFRQSMAIVAMIGSPSGFDEPAAAASTGKVAETGRNTPEPGPQPSRPYRLVRFDDPGQFPNSALALDALDVLVLAGKYPLTHAQDRALRDWVGNGGHLVVCRGSGLEAFVSRSRKRLAAAGVGGILVGLNRAAAARPPRLSGDALLASWLPVTIEGQSRLRDLDAIETFAQRKSPIIFSGRIRAALLRDPRRMPGTAGAVLAAGRAGPLIVRIPFGMGLVTFVGLDLDRPPLSSWKEVHAVGQRLLEVSLAGGRGAVGGGRLSRSGVTDLSTQLHRLLDDFPGVRRMSAWETIGLLLVYILLIGPADYLLVHRVLKRPRLTWITFPLLVGLATFFSVYSAEQRNGGARKTNQPLLNQLQIVDVDGTSSPSRSRRPNVRTHMWATVYSLESQRYVIDVQPNALTDRDGELPQDAAVCWSGIPESVYGGMHRASGLEIARLSYDLDSGFLKAVGVPLRLWSSRTMKAEWDLSLPGVVESRLVVDAGWLTGTLTHHLKGPITSWILVHGTKLYASNAKDGGPIRPGRPFSVWRGNVTQVGLHDVLTARKTAFADAKKDQTILEQTAYDPSSRDADALLRMLTFHAAADGRNYTGLDNFPLGRLDLSRLLPLNRAVLLGRIDRRAAVVSLGAGNSNDTETKSIEPTRSDTFVRIVLPVHSPESSSP
ncbi:MAG: hypothetical protein ACE5KM_08935 [Planctomycetaceae bacterium]